MTDGMLSLLLYRDSRQGKVSVGGSSDECLIGGRKYYASLDYFGEWAPILNHDEKFVGFTIIPTVDNNFIENKVLNTDFVRSSSNVVVERSDYTYIHIELFGTKGKRKAGMNRIEATLLQNAEGEIAFRIEGVLLQDLPRLELVLRQSEWH